MITVLTGDCRDVLRTLPDASVQTCVTSPPYYGLRDYGHADQIGLERSPAEYVAHMVAVFREVQRVLRPDGTLWLNLGDSYAANRKYQVPSTKGGAKHSPAQAANGASSTVPDGLKPKDLIGIPWRVAFALQDDGWYLRQDIIWHKPNPMPESVTDRCTKAHEYVFLLSKSARYFYDAAAVAEPGVGRETYFGSDAYRKGSGRNDAGEHDPTKCETRNRRSVWTIASEPYRGAHYAVMPPSLAEVCVRAGSKPGDTVLDPFGGAGTTGMVADRLRRNATLIELNPANVALIRQRMAEDAGLLAEIQTGVEPGTKPDLFVSATKVEQARLFGDE